MKPEEKLFWSVIKNVRCQGIFCDDVCGYIKAHNRCDLFPGELPDYKGGRAERRELCKKIFGIVKI